MVINEKTNYLVKSYNNAFDEIVLIEKLWAINTIYLNDENECNLYAKKHQKLMKILDACKKELKVLELQYEY